MIDFKSKEYYSFEDLVEVIHLLRTPEGCPWDSVQTHESIRRNFLEETYEACEAIDLDDEALMKEELGDVLMQVIFHADIEKDRGRFTLENVCDVTCKKLLFRHPNVFGGPAEQSWDDMKELEKGRTTQTQALDSVARSLPSLWRAEKLVKKAAKAGFVWPEMDGALAKLEEETAEFRQAVEQGGNVSEELGDVLFAAVCAGALQEADPEMALHQTCEKFISRFAKVEQAAAALGCRVEDLTKEQQLAFWQAAKVAENA